MSDLVLSPPLSLAVPIDADLLKRSAELGKKNQSPNTVRAYASDWARFGGWCRHHGCASLPATENTIRTHLAQLEKEGLRFSTISRAYAAIRVRHAEAGERLPTLPTVTEALRNLAKDLGSASHGKSPLVAGELRRVVAHAADTALAIRDRAILLLGFAAALRRSELVALDCSDLHFSDDGLKVSVRRSKTDQRGEGRTIGVPYGSRAACPVRAVKAWLAAASITSGPVFRPIDRGDHVGAQRLAPAAVARAVKRAAELVGLDPKDFAGHSLRSGLATSAAKAGKGLDVIMNTTGHKSERVARGYIKHATVFDACASEGLL
jgi:integrase